MLKIGILALQGNVAEHKAAIENAAKKIGMKIEAVEARQKKDLHGLDAIILPGGESTTISMLIERQGMLEDLKRINAIFGTCAGLILMAKEVEGLEKGQKTLELMDVRVSRNAYGSQINSFAAELEGTVLENEYVTFIRAPKIISTGKNVKILEKLKNSEEIVVVEQKNNGQYLLGATCHPELNSTKLHEYFLREIEIQRMHGQKN